VVSKESLELRGCDRLLVMSDCNPHRRTCCSTFIPLPALHHLPMAYPYRDLPTALGSPIEHSLTHKSVASSSLYAQLPRGRVPRYGAIPPDVETTMPLWDWIGVCPDTPQIVVMKVHRMIHERRDGMVNMTSTKKIHAFVHSNLNVYTKLAFAH